MEINILIALFNVFYWLIYSLYNNFSIYYINDNLQNFLSFTKFARQMVHMCFSGICMIEIEKDTSYSS